MKANSGLANSQQTVDISSQILQSPNVDSSSSMDLSNELIINERVAGYRRDREQNSDDSTSALLPATNFSTPSIKHRFSFKDSQ